MPPPETQASKPSVRGLVPRSAWVPPPKTQASKPSVSWMVFQIQDYCAAHGLAIKDVALRRLCDVSSMIHQSKHVVVRTDASNCFLGFSQLHVQQSDFTSMTLVFRFCYMSSVRSTSDCRGPVTRKRVPDREEPGKPRKDAQRGRCHPLE